MDKEIDRVVPLDELSGYEVARGEPDVRGWDVIAGDGRRIGEVDELLVDAAARKVRFLDVSIDQELVPDVDATQRIIIPIASARVGDEDRVFVDGLSSSEVLFSGDGRREAVRDDPDDRQRDHQRADAPVIVERERAIVQLDP